MIGYHNAQWKPKTRIRVNYNVLYYVIFLYYYVIIYGFNVVDEVVKRLRALNRGGGKACGA